jgi:ribose transport system ATP-binding protein
MVQPPLLELKRLSKSYPGVQALKDVDLELYAGEVHFLLGENGAGKSTLMKILSGSVQKESGTILLNGVPIEISSPVDSRQYMIAMVYQELSLLPSLTVAENIFLGELPQKEWNKMIDWKRVYRETEAALEAVGLHIPPQRLVKDLSVGEKQLIEIAKAVSRKARILLLDEPTSALSGEECNKLFRLIKDLKQKGIAILYISHRLAEVPTIAQRVSVLRDGEKIGTYPIADVTEQELIRMMVGREIKDKYPKEKIEIGKPLLNVSGLNLKKRLKNINFTVNEGEIVGFFGLMGAGRTSLANVLFGIENPESGKIQVNGSAVNIKSPWDAICTGFGYITEDRRGSLAPRMSIAANITLPNLKCLLSWGILHLVKEKRIVQNYVEELKIATPSLQQLCEYLSGGNQQKVVLARWICAGSKILLLDEPTRGIDVGSKVEVYRLMGQLAKEGAAILMFSSELPEVMAVSDRVLVMCEGEIVASYNKGDATPDEIMLYATGGRTKCG